MDTQEQIIEPIKKQTEPKVENKKFLAIIIALIILAVGGFVFGGVQLQQNMQMKGEIEDLKSERSEEQLAVDDEQSDDSSQVDSMQNNALQHWNVIDYSRSAFDKAKCKNCQQDLDYGVTTKVAEELYYQYDEDYENSVDFGKPVAYTFQLGYGHDGHIVLYVFSDGTAGYTSMMHEFTYGLIPDLQNVVGFVGGWIDQGEDVSSSRYANTIFAVLSDGSYVLLNDWLNGLIKSGA